MDSDTTRGKGLTRRRVIGGTAALAAGGAALAGGGGLGLADDGGALQGLQEAAARQEIEYLRRLYGEATDLLGPGKDREATMSAADRKALGRSMYRRIFTPDATIIANGSPPGGVVGPDAWADYVVAALAPFTATQHLLGTQIVTLKSMPANGKSPVKQSLGKATMQSYLNALHEFAPGGNILIVRGTYFDAVRWTPGTGWQIEDMNLVFTSVELRPHP